MLKCLEKEGLQTTEGFQTSFTLTSLEMAKANKKGNTQRCGPAPLILLKFHPSPVTHQEGKCTFFFVFWISVNVLVKIRSIHDVYKATKRPKKGTRTQKPKITPYKEPTQSTNSNNDKELSPMYDLTHKGLRKNF